MLGEVQIAIEFHCGVAADQGPGQPAETALAERSGVLNPHNPTVDLPGAGKIVGSRQHQRAAAVLDHGTSPTDLAGKGGAEVIAAECEGISGEIHPATQAAATRKSADGFAGVEPKQRAGGVRQGDGARVGDGATVGQSQQTPVEIKLAREGVNAAQHQCPEAVLIQIPGAGYGSVHGQDATVRDIPTLCRAKADIVIKGQILRCNGHVNTTRTQSEDVGAIDGNWPTGVEHLQPVPADVGAEKSRVGSDNRALPAGGVVRGGGQAAYPTLAIAQRGCIVRLDEHTGCRHAGHLEVINPEELAGLV